MIFSGFLWFLMNEISVNEWWNDLKWPPHHLIHPLYMTDPEGWIRLSWSIQGHWSGLTHSPPSAFSVTKTKVFNEAFASYWPSLIGQPIKEQKARLKTRPKPGGQTHPGRQSSPSLECVGVLQPLSVSHDEHRAQGSNFWPSGHSSPFRHNWLSSVQLIFDDLLFLDSF